jgi:hypothetical protein
LGALADSTSRYRVSIGACVTLIMLEFRRSVGEIGNSLSGDFMVALRVLQVVPTPRPRPRRRTRTFQFISTTGANSHQGRRLHSTGLFLYWHRRNRSRGNRRHENGLTIVTRGNWYYKARGVLSRLVCNGIGNTEIDKDGACDYLCSDGARHESNGRPTIDCLAIPLERVV